ncbi:DUF5683 domain-containing protein [Bacteroidota bacterium]
MPKILDILFFILILFTGISEKTDAQRIKKDIPRDSLLILQPGMDTTRVTSQADSIYIDEATLNRPKVAAFYSAALPGLGQIYNNSYWKLPIIYGGFITMGHYINWNNNKYQQFRNALLDKIDDDGIITNPLAEYASEDLLRRNVEYYRRNRDLLMVLTVGLYFLQIVEAHVEAHLMEFVISEDLTVELKPGINSCYAGNYNYGIKLVFTLN